MLLHWLALGMVRCVNDVDGCLPHAVEEGNASIGVGPSSLLGDNDGYRTIFGRLELTLPHRKQIPALRDAIAIPLFVKCPPSLVPFTRCARVFWQRWRKRYLNKA